MTRPARVTTHTAIRCLETTVQLTIIDQTDPARVLRNPHTSLTGGPNPSNASCGGGPPYLCKTLEPTRSGQQVPSFQPTAATPPTVPYFAPHLKILKHIARTWRGDCLDQLAHWFLQELGPVRVQGRFFLVDDDSQEDMGPLPVGGHRRSRQTSVWPSWTRHAVAMMGSSVAVHLVGN